MMIIIKQLAAIENTIINEENKKEAIAKFRFKI